MRLNRALPLLALFTGCAQDYEIVNEPVDVDPGDVTECDFTKYEQTDFYEYDCNPVFTSSGESWAGDIGSIGFHTTEVSGHPFYQMWYSADTTNGSAYQIGYAISGDGTNWDTHPSNPLLTAAPGAWDQDSMSGLQVLWDEDESLYVMTYQGVTLPTDAFDPGRWGMGVATSDDGVRWAKHPANPVIDFNDPIVSDTLSPCWPLTLTKRVGSYISYVGASAPDPFGFGQPRCDVYTSVGTGLSNWSFTPSPALVAGAWYDASGILAADIVEFEGQFYMFYIGFEEWVDSGLGYVSTNKPHIALATSSDGATWTKWAGNPILSPEVSVDARSIGAEVIGSRIHIWVSSYYEELDTNAVGYFLYEPNRDAPADADTDTAE